MHVLLLLEYPTRNGGENSLLALVPYLQDSGIQLSAAAPSTGDLADALRGHGVDLLPLPRQPDLSQADRRDQLARLIQHVRPTLVHANSVSMSRLAGPVCRDLNIKSLGHLRDMMRLSRAALEDVSLHRRLLAVSHATRHWYGELGIPPSRMHVLYNGVDIQHFRPRPATGYLHHELQLDRSTMLIGSIGQIGMRKGLDVLLEAARIVVRDYPNVCFLIVGQRHSEKAEAVAYEQTLHQLVDTALADKVRFLGRREDVGQLLPELTLLVHLARQEPLGRVLLEGAASGCCIVASNVGGTSEIFPPQEHAAYLIQSDSRAAARAMSELFEDASKRQQMGTRARRRAAEMFRDRDTAQGLLHHYDALQ